VKGRAAAVVVCRPYQQRRAYATFRAAWPEVEAVFASGALSLDNYVRSIGDAKLVINMIVGDTQHVIDYPQAGFAAEQAVPKHVRAAYRNLVKHGFTSRHIKAT
jgi:hypothetical protein